MVMTNGSRHARQRLRTPKAADAWGHDAQSKRSKPCSDAGKLQGALIATLSKVEAEALLQKVCSRKVCDSV
jgi:hypothetical protein